MSIQSIFLVVLVLGFILGVLCTQLLRYAADYARHISLRRERAMRAHPAGGRGNLHPAQVVAGNDPLHVGRVHVPRSRERDTDSWWDKIYGDDMPLPIEVPRIPVPRKPSNELPPGWEFPMECSE